MMPSYTFKGSLRKLVPKLEWSVGLQCGKCIQREFFSQWKVLQSVLFISEDREAADVYLASRILGSFGKLKYKITIG